MGEDDGDGRAEEDARPYPDFDAFFKRVYPELIKYCLVICRDLTQAEEAAAITMSAIYPHWEKIGKPRHYALRAARNNLIRLGRDKARTITTDPGELPDRGALEPGYAEFEDRARIEQIYGRLSDKQAEVLQYWVDGRCLRELVIADRQARGCPPDPVAVAREWATKRKILQTAKEKVRTWLRDAKTFPPDKETA